jgi:hypothetical protein
MNTNQTIDGVSRVLLDLCYRAMKGAAKDELRALLDAPAAPDPVQWDGVGLPPVGAVCEFGNDRIGWKKVRVTVRQRVPEPGEKALSKLVGGEALFHGCAEHYRPLPAAQPQGEPVAWMYRREGGECLGQLVQMESDSLKAMREGMMGPLQRILWPREDCIDWKPLYAKQTAPVAVVLPERKREATEESDIMVDCHNEGWNSCIDEVTRLNTKD